MSATTEALIKSKLVSKNVNEGELPIDEGSRRLYDNDFSEFPFELTCSYNGDFIMKYIIGVPIDNAQKTYGKVIISNELLECEYYVVEESMINGEFFGKLSYYNTLLVDSYTFNNPVSFNQALFQFATSVHDMDTVSKYQCLVNGLYIMSRQYATDKLSFKTNYLSENSANLQGYYSSDGEIHITNKGVLRGTYSDVTAKLYYFKVERVSFGGLRREQLYLRKIDKNKLYYTCSFDRKLSVLISEYRDDYNDAMNYLNYVSNLLQTQPNISSEIATEIQIIQIDSLKLLRNLSIPFRNNKIPSVRTDEVSKSSINSTVLSVSYSFIEIYRGEKFVGFVIGYNPKTLEVRKSVLPNNRLEWKTDSKFKCSAEETQKIQDLLYKLQRCPTNNGYTFKINHYKANKFILASELKT
jgi:hypothetical protein